MKQRLGIGKVVRRADRLGTTAVSAWWLLTIGGMLL